MKLTLMGNEAIAYGLLHSNTKMVSGYPGTPSSEILTTVQKIKKDLPVYAEWATNEKVGFEVAYAGAIAGVNAAATMKQVGLNVASDALMSASFIGNKGAFVLIVADDPGFNSSQTEQDSREFARFARIPVVDPATPQEAYDFTKLASKISKHFEIPVMLRTVMRVSHSREIVEIDGNFEFKDTEGNFERDIPRWAAVPRAGRLKQAYEQLDRLDKIREYNYNELIKPKIEELKGTENLIISSGTAYGYVKEVLEELGLDIDLLKIDMPYPLPVDKLKDLVKKYNKVLVVEETYPVIEEEIRSENVYGRMSGHMHQIDEMNKERVLEALTKIGFYNGENIYKPVFTPENPKTRKPNLCPGCPHRDVYFAIKKVFRPKKSIYPSDIGCYTLGINLDAIDTVLCMGGSVSMAHGFAIADKNKTVIATIGDSTFFHSGTAPLINAVYQKAKFILVILDNSTTAMTGRQTTPERATSGEVDIKKVAEGCGAEVMEYFYKPDINETINFFKEVKKRFDETDRPLVVVSRQYCVLDKERATQFLPGIFATVDEEKCVACDVCTTQYVCPPMAYNERGKIEIDPLLCIGCGVCISGICPTDAFIPREK
ncbi:indolepyruvate oxidoreductase subunit IorA [Nautilia profundicola AmH]|uniref:Indolepyruvate oxidoreductase subunit IorA n=1 Tax=Nautilia profundicola (strain ATCC BAA-1463 / DSM 18972 / AmH) TaxID=598659 RepID=B9L9T4_NAUPA|nr:thiamine pyrophosphate-dependent enzyme [Nautilia profundicola]ACM93625.1 indolepyruvate oxidoreductase subunit IorA [Nautilia profundicola AmH]